MNTRPFLAAAAALLLTLAASAQAPDAAALHQQSLDSVKQKNFKDAVDFAEKATKADPTKAEYFSQLGVALSQRMNEVNFMQMAVLSGRMRKAFEKSVELDPNHIAGLIGLARFHTNAPEIAGGSLEKARSFAERLVKLNPLLGEIELGHIASKGEDHLEALKHYEAAAALKPDNPGLQNACGTTLVKLGRKAEARARFEAALRLKPDFESVKQALAALDAAPTADAPPAPKG
jgi:Flp pilus assembly protein TadD